MMKQIDKKNRLSLSKKLKIRIKFLLIVLSANFYFAYSQEIIEENIIYFTDDRGPFSLEIEVIELKNNEGFLMIGLFDKNKNKIAAIKKVPIFNRKSKVKIDSLSSGQYVVRFWHDINKNEQLDLNFFGIPKEGFGNSNNIPPKFGPPKFEDMIFDIEKNIHLKMITQNLNL